MDLIYISPIVIGAAASVLVVLERRYPFTPGQRILREGFWNDLLMYSIVQNYILGLLIALLIVWIDHTAMFSRYQLITHWPMWLQVAVFLIAHDFYIYWFHRLQHRSEYLWRIHEAHHSTREVDWLAGSRSHAVEILINQTVEFAPIVFLGAAPEVALIKGMISACWGMWIHSNINAHGGWLRYIINGPEMHRWHHSDVVADGSFNFATKFALWDWMFGTARIMEQTSPDGYGLKDVAYPQNYFSQQVFAFRSFKTEVGSEQVDYRT